jgi:uncharacterized protein (DUF1800 family)
MSLRDAAIAAGRFGYGARPGELAEIASDPRGWIKAQLTPERAPPAVIAALPPAEDDLWAFGRWLIETRRNAAKAAPDGRAPYGPAGPDRPDDATQAPGARARGASGAAPDGAMTAEGAGVEEAFVRSFRTRTSRAALARLEAAVASERPVYERLIHFWSNHFTVSAAKPAAVALPPSFEHDVVRPRAAGRFADMLLASSKHPGMLVYLDNWQSVGPNSPVGLAAARGPAPGPGPGPDGPARARRGTGLNENLAREILELHTLGVDGGYRQSDVLALAKIITGWTYDRSNVAAFMSGAPGVRSGAQLFAFAARAHEPGAKTLLGRTYAEDGLAQGEAALADLARHPATARFLAAKLARHYIGDDPPPAAVARIAQRFCDSDGDIAETMAALVDSPETWAGAFAKYKRPEEYAISVARALAANTPGLDRPGLGLPQPGLPQPGLLGRAGPQVLQSVSAMGQRIYRAPGPDGWADVEAAWLNADMIWKRIEFANGVARRAARADIDPRAIADATLGPLVSTATREAIARAESPAQGLTLLLASPEFQRR